MPKNFAFFQKPLDKFFYKFDNSEINRQEIFPASFKNIGNREGFQIGPQIWPIFPPDFVFTSERPHYSLALFSSFICTCTTSKRYKFASKRTLDYFPKKYPVYANITIMASLRCHGDSDCNKTQIIRNFHLYIIQLW